MFKKKPPQNVGRTRATQPAPRGPVFSYANNRSARPGASGRSIAEQQQQQEALRRGPRFPWLKRVPTIASLLAVVVVAIACLQLSANAKVLTVGAAETQVFLRDRGIYEAAARKAFTPLLNSNKLTVDAGTIADDLRKQFPELAVVSVSLPVLGNRPTVYIQPAAPRLILVANGGMYLLDRDGRALITANQVPQLEKLKIPVVTDQSSLPVTVGKVVLPHNTVGFIEEVVGQLQAKHIAITSLTLPAGTNELHVRVEGAGYYVKFNLYGKAREEVGAYIAVREHLQATHKTVGEYIDVRVENRAYYR
jgi:cell division septal protein FtsQ